MQIALKHEIEIFLDCPRIQMIMIHLYSEFDFLNPKYPFRTSMLSSRETLKKFIINPTEFYYCPVGRFYIESLMYILYVFVVTYILYNPPFAEHIGNQYQHDLTLILAPIEIIMWIFNVGYWVTEISELFMYGRQYFNDVGNVWDLFIILNWIIIAIVRFGCITSFPESSCTENNGSAVITHMFVFCIQIVILWSRIALIFKTNRVFGPFLLMIPAMIKDIINWVFVLSIFFGM